MFKSLLNINTAFKLTRNIAIIAIMGSVVISIYAITVARSMVAESREKVYVLDQGKSLILALQQDVDQNRPVEARSHIKLFHELFFTLSPDADAVNSSVSRALYLADKSAYNYHKDLLEAGFYKRLVAANIRQRIVVDTISIDFANYPYDCKVIATQIIVRESNITRRTLNTECTLSYTGRSDNNPHGFLIQNFNVTKNEDKETQSKI